MWRMKKQTLIGLFQKMTKNHPETRTAWFSYRYMNSRQFETHVNNLDQEKYEVLCYAYRPLSLLVNYVFRKRFYSLFINMDVIDMDKWKVREFSNQYEAERKVKSFIAQGWNGNIYDEIIPLMESSGFGRYVGKIRTWEYSMNRINWRNDWGVHPTKKSFGTQHIWQEPDEGKFVFCWKKLKNENSWWSKWRTKESRKEMAEVLTHGVSVADWEKVKKKELAKKDKQDMSHYSGHYMRFCELDISKEDQQKIIKQIMLEGDGDDGDDD